MINQNKIVYSYDNNYKLEFSSRNEVRQAIKECAKKAGFAVSTRNSYDIYLFMACRHYGNTRFTKNLGDTSKNDVSSGQCEKLPKKTGCPFKIKATARPAKDGKQVWCITGVSPMEAHNHPMAKNLYSYPMKRHFENAD